MKVEKLEITLKIDEIEFNINYELIGSYIAETREITAEKPDILVTKVSVCDSNINLLGFLSNIHIDTIYCQIENNL